MNFGKKGVLKRIPFFVSGQVFLGILGFYFSGNDTKMRHINYRNVPFWISARLNILHDHFPAWLSTRLDTLHEHFCRQYKIYILLLLTYWLFASRFEFAINLSDSLPGKVFVIEKGILPAQGEYVAFAYENDFLFPRGIHLLKRVAGIAGNAVISRDHKYYVGGKFVGEALPVTSQGFPIRESGLNGVIPPGYYYTQADHPKSFDSRYAALGLVPFRCVIGKAYKVF